MTAVNKPASRTRRLKGREEHDQRIIDGAKYWTTARHLGRGSFDRREHESREAARTFAEQTWGRDGRTMVYAVDDRGLSAWAENV